MALNEQTQSNSTYRMYLNYHLDLFEYVALQHVDPRMSMAYRSRQVEASRFA